MTRELDNFIGTVDVPEDPALRTVATQAALAELGAWLIWHRLEVVATDMDSSAHCFDLLLKVEDTITTTSYSPHDEAEKLAGELFVYVAAVVATLNAR
jgi:hypothetical protein